MARYVGPSCRFCRREGEKLFLKGTRCFSDKCAFERRGYSPGEHGASRSGRRKGSEYGLQLREKQKVRRLYGLLETQFHNLFQRADGMAGITGENLLMLLECRLDNVVYRLGFAPSRKSARQLVRHRHFTVGGRVVDIPSYPVAPREVIRVREQSRNLDIIHQALKEQGRELALPYLRLDKARLEGELLEAPKRSDIPTLCSEQMIVELYSK
ncbi:MAG: 30S ribosomal protein S4 [candidate division Zixibacteria bacterium]|nr:30S ribosomal protein S4 [candidate division Zixibacteria bacterium]